MTLTGEYTQAGALLAAQIQAGAASLTLTRAAAGPGVTAADAAGMTEEKQALTLQTHSLSGTTLTVPALLISVEAAEAYAMREIGLYARSAEGVEILYKLYRFDQAVSVSPLCSLVATFYLNDTVAVGSQPTVLATVQGLLTQGDIPGIAVHTTNQIGRLITTESNYNGGTQIACKASELATVIGALPKLINDIVTIMVTEDNISPGVVEVHGFYGPGRLTIQGKTQVKVGTFDIHSNRLPRLIINNFMTNGDTYLTTINTNSCVGCGMAVRNCEGIVELLNVTVGEYTGSLALTGLQVMASHCLLTRFLAKGRRSSFVAYRGARVAFRSFSATGAHGLNYVLEAYHCSTVTWPGVSSTLSGQTGCGSYICASSSMVIFTDTIAAASGFTSGEY